MKTDTHFIPNDLNANPGIREFVGFVNIVIIAESRENIMVAIRLYAECGSACVCVCVRFVCCTTEFNHESISLISMIHFMK